MWPRGAVGGEGRRDPRSGVERRRSRARAPPSLRPCRSRFLGQRGGGGGREWRRGAPAPADPCLPAAAGGVGSHRGVPPRSSPRALTLVSMAAAPALARRAGGRARLPRAVATAQPRAPSPRAFARARAFAREKRPMTGRVRTRFRTQRAKPRHEFRARGRAARRTRRRRGLNSPRSKGLHRHFQRRGAALRLGFPGFARSNEPDSTRTRIPRDFGAARDPDRSQRPLPSPFRIFLPLRRRAPPAGARDGSRGRESSPASKARIAAIVASD